MAPCGRARGNIRGRNGSGGCRRRSSGTRQNVLRSSCGSGYKTAHQPPDPRNSGAPQSGADDGRSSRVITPPNETRRCECPRSAQRFDRKPPQAQRPRREAAWDLLYQRPGVSAFSQRSRRALCRFAPWRRLAAVPGERARRMRDAARCRRSGIGAASRNGKLVAADFRTRRIGVDCNLGCKRIAAVSQLAGEIDGKTLILARSGGTGENGLSIAIEDYIPAFRGGALQLVGRDRLHRLAVEAIAAPEPGHRLDVGSELELIAIARNAGHPAAPRDRVGVEGSDAQRVAEVAKGLERGAVCRPALQPIGTVGHQEMVLLFEEGGESRPAAPRLVGTDETVQCLWPPTGGGELLD